MDRILQKSIVTSILSYEKIVFSRIHYPVSSHVSSARASCTPSLKRVSGIFSRQRKMISSSADGILGLNWLGGVGKSCMCCMATATGVSPSKGERPVSISYMTTPSAYTSVVGVTFLPCACSGAQYLIL